MMEMFVWGIIQTTSMGSTEKPPMHLQIDSNSPVTQTKTELGVSNCGTCDTHQVQKAKSCSHENMHKESHADKSPSKPSGKHCGAKSNT